MLCIHSDSNPAYSHAWTARRYLTNLSFILFGLSGLLGVAVSVHHLLRGPCPVRQPQFPPSQAVPAAAAQPNGAAPGGRGATGAVHPIVNGVALAPGDSGATRPAGPGAGSARSQALGSGKAGSGGFRDYQPRGACRGAGAPGAVHGADVRSADSGEWPVYEVSPAQAPGNRVIGF